MAEPMETKICKKCGEKKPVTAFVRNTSYKDGRLPSCKSCYRVVSVRGAGPAYPVVDGQKECAHCHATQLVTEFHKSGKKNGSVMNICKACRRAQATLRPRHHVDPTVVEKTCVQCGKTKPVSEFHRHCNRQDGLQTMCKPCACAHTAAWVDQPGNREKTLIWAGEQRLRQAGDEAVLAYHRRKGKEWTKANPDKAHARERRHRLKRTKTQIVEYVDVEVLYDRDKGMCSLCLEPVKRSLTFPDPKSKSVDHIIPLSLGGEESYPNTALAHLICNTRKKNKIIPEQVRAFLGHGICQELTRPSTSHPIVVIGICF